MVTSAVIGSLSQHITVVAAGTTRPPETQRLSICLTPVENKNSRRLAGIVSGLFDTRHLLSSGLTAYAETSRSVAATNNSRTRSGEMSGFQIIRPLLELSISSPATSQSSRTLPVIRLACGSK